MNKLVTVSAWLCLVVYPFIALVCAWAIIQHGERFQNLDAAVGVSFLGWFMLTLVTVVYVIHRDWKELQLLRRDGDQSSEVLSK